MIEIGQRLPDAEFYTVREGLPHRRSARELFDGRRVALFAVPGAFTPTCSSAHVPRFESLAQAFRDSGIDEVVCIAVNDPFVLDAWREQLGVAKLSFLADPRGDFARAVGLIKDLGPLGARSRRYSLLVRDGVVEQAFVEKDGDDDPYEVSDADTLLKAVTGQRAAAPWFLFARHYCPYCTRAIAELDRRGIAYEVAYLGRGLSTEGVRAVTGRATVPQLFHESRHIGGMDDLLAYFESKSASGDASRPQLDVGAP